MKIYADADKAFALLDTLLERWTAIPKQFPYNKRGAIIPQTLVPDDIRKDKVALSLFYFYTCIYMRGGIESAQAFKALLRLREDDPALFDPFQAQWYARKDVAKILKRYIGWDSNAAARSWVENSYRLVQTWGGNPLNLLKNLNTYEEALRRIRNKTTRRDQRTAGADGHGFRGFQPKMVSMLIYFLDWEGLLKKRFLYPAPADFHNFRLALATGSLKVTPEQKEIRTSERLSKPWRDVLMRYLRTRKADPLHVADALWLFSLVMCGNSPFTKTRDVSKLNGSGLFPAEHLPHLDDQTSRIKQIGLMETCVVCPIKTSCQLAIPARPYYTKGLLVLTPREKVEVVVHTRPKLFGEGSTVQYELGLLPESGE